MQIIALIKNWLFWLPVGLVALWCVFQIVSARKNGVIRNHQLIELDKENNPVIFGATLAVYYVTLVICVVVLIVSFLVLVKIIA
ncbi:MAG: hypothetical protein NVV72_00020 [Asticcacaulis sp.]|nr:hypothetical protein [Asticcacaulis sp.]